MRVALKVQHGVDHVLEHARPGQRALLGHVTDQHHAHATGLGQAREVGRAFAHLRHRTRRRGQLVGVHGLDRIDHGDGRPGGVELGEDLFQLDLGQHIDLTAAQTQALRPQRDLGAAFLAGDIQRARPGALQRIERLQQQG